MLKSEQSSRIVVDREILQRRHLGPFSQFGNLSNRNGFTWIFRANSQYHPVPSWVTMHELTFVTQSESSEHWEILEPFDTDGLGRLEESDDSHTLFTESRWPGRAKDIHRFRLASARLGHTPSYINDLLFASSSRLLVKVADQ